MRISVIIPTHNPDPSRLVRTLLGLRAQSLPSDQWETLLIDNASTPALSPLSLTENSPPNLRIVSEPKLGLSHARRTGMLAARAPFLLLVDDDNVLAPDYLAHTLAAFERLPQVGALGGKSIPEFPANVSFPPDDWRREFCPLLALRDLGESELISSGLRPPGAVRNTYPAFAPIGAGMALRREAADAWLRHASTQLTDRRGSELTSAGDNDIVLHALREGWEVAYLPQLQLTHLIPASRLDPAYLARLNFGIQKSWMQVLTLHDANPWSPLTPFSARLRILKAWFHYRAWKTPAHHIRWQGARGHFHGRTFTRHD